MGCRCGRDGADKEGGETRRGRDGGDKGEGRGGVGEATHGPRDLLGWSQRRRVVVLVVIKGGEGERRRWGGSARNP